MADDETDNGKKDNPEKPRETSAHEMGEKFSESYKRLAKCHRCQRDLPEDRFALCVECDDLRQAEIELYQTRVRNERIAQKLNYSGLPRAYVSKERGFSEVRDPEARGMGIAAIEGGMPGLYIHGDAGPDKTTLLASCVAAWIRAKDAGGRFISALDLISDIDATRPLGAELTRNDIVKPLIDVACLGIDDLGKERASTFTASVLYQILDGRYQKREDGAVYPLFITSNYSLEELCNRFDERNFGEPIMRRISEMTVPIRMEAHA